MQLFNSKLLTQTHLFSLLGELINAEPESLPAGEDVTIYCNCHIFFSPVLFFHCDESNTHKIYLTAQLHHLMNHMMRVLFQMQK